MKLIKYIKSGALLILTLTVSMSIFAQETAVSKEIKQPIYEQLGVSSTTLFMIMLTFTILLLIILVALIQSTKNVLYFKKGKTKTGLLVIALCSSFFSSALSPEETVNTEAFVNFTDSAFWAFLTLDIIMVMLILYFAGIIKGVLSEYSREKRPITLFSRWNKTLTNAVDIEEEDSILLDHDYDGIQELDNDLPPWWKYGFYITIVWGVIYFGVYQLFGIAESQSEEYITQVNDHEREIAAYKAANPNLINEDNVTLLSDAASLAKGKKIFTDNCAVCHKADGGGSVGPNLTDNAWLYDYDIKGVFHTISEGANNGMISWKESLNGVEMQTVASYILSLEPAKEGKPAEGENIKQ